MASASEPPKTGISLGLFSELSIEGPREAPDEIDADAVHIAIENG
jgi:hypothetical protein